MSAHSALFSRFLSRNPFDAYRYLSGRAVSWLLLVVLLCLSGSPVVKAQELYGPLEMAQWIALEPQTDVTVPLIHAPFVKKALADRTVGEYQMPVFVRRFTARKNVRRATLWVCGLGHFEATIDGNKVGDHFFDPGWTCYDREAEYVTFDVTSMLQEQATDVLGEFAQRFKRGEHELRVELGGGFYNIPRGRYNKVAGSYGVPRLRLRLHIEYQTGRDEDIVTDERWLAGPSQITYSSIYGGEDVDLRRTLTLGPVLTLGCEGPRLREQRGTEVVRLATLRPQTRWQLDNGDWVFDFGQNMSGIPAAQLRGQAGQEVHFIPAELKGDDGSAYHKPVGNWQYHVTLGADEAVRVAPRFSYTGFRYLQVHGAVPDDAPNPAGLPVLTDLQAWHTASVTARQERGTFACDVPFFNDVHRIIDWAIRSNLQSVITDCPHREKLGWLEQDHLMMPSMYYRYDLAPLYRKLMCDMEASQFSRGQDLGLGAESTAVPGCDYEGMIPTIAPYYTNFGWNFDDTPEWGSAFIIAPWYHYLWTGSDELFRQHFPAMMRYIDYLTRRAEANGYILSYGLGDWYDLGPDKPGYAQLTSEGVTATATYYYDVTLMARMARHLAEHDPAAAGLTSERLAGVALQYETLAETIRTAYNERFLHHDDAVAGMPMAHYDRNSQCANAVSLYMGLVPDSLRASVLWNLAHDVEQRLYAVDHPEAALFDWGSNGPTVITAGDVGYRYMLMMLAQGGRHDLIADMNMRADVPGYAMQLAKGATTLTESWQALRSVSNNHLMLGHILEWMYGYLGGLRQEEGSVGWQAVVIEPHPVGGVKDCQVSYQSPRGPIKVHWRIEGDRCYIDYTAPKSVAVRVVNPATTGELLRN